ncbi:MAG: PKD domain-containing protein [Pseudomonadota bacterium]
MRNQILAIDVSAWSKAALIANFGATQVNNTAFIGELNALALFLDGIIASLVGDPLVADNFPIVDAGGPYNPNETSALILDASNSLPGTGASSIIEYAWDLDGDGEFDDATGVSPSVQVNSKQSGVIGLKLTNDRGKMNIGYASITVNDTNPAPSLIGFSTPDLRPLVITGSVQQFTVNATDNGSLSIEWFLDGVSVATGMSFNYMPGIADVGAHNLVAVIDDGTSSGGAVTQTWLISVKEVDGDSDGFTVTGGDCNDTDAGINPAATEIIDNGIDDDCNANTEDADQPPVANFFSVPFLGVPGEPMMLQSNSTDPNGDITSYLWDFGDGSPTSTEQNPGHTFTQAVTYSVTLTVTDSQGNSNAATLPVEVVGAIVNTRVSDPDLDNQDTLGDQGDDNVGLGFDITPNGRWLVFASLAENIVTDDTNGAADIFVLDRETGKVVRVSVHTDGSEGRVVNSFTNLTLFNSQPTISPDGRYVGFLSEAENLIGEDLDDDGRCDLPVTFTNGGCTGHRGEIFVRDRDSDGNGIFDEPGGVETLVASRYFRNEDGGAGARSMSMSENTCRFGFEATGADYVDGVGPVGGIVTPHVFMVDRCTNEIRVVSKDIFGVAIRGFFRHLGNYSHRISADGRYLVWYSHFDDRVGRGVGGTGAGIVGEDTDNDGLCDTGCSTRGDGLNADAYLYDWVTDKNQQVSINTLGEPATYNEVVGSSFAAGGGSGSTLPSISSDGRFVVFFSSANNLNLDALNNVIPMPEAAGREQDIYVHDRDKDGNGIFDEPGGIETKLISKDLNGLANGQETPGVTNDSSFVDGSATGLAQNAIPQVSNNGRFVTYRGNLSRTVPGEFSSTARGIVLHDVLAGTNSTPFFDLDGDPTAFINFFLRHDGRFIAIRTNSAEVTGIDANGDGRCRETQGDLDCDTNSRGDFYLQDRDADNDGLFGDVDECLNTPPQADIDDDGCTLPIDLAIAMTTAQSPIASGAASVFTVSVRNVGLASLVDVSITDPVLPDCERSIGDLLPGDAFDYECSLTNTLSTFEHTARVTGESSAGEMTSAEATAGVEIAEPGISIVHSPDPKEVNEGGDYVLSVSVENTGPIALNNVVVNASPVGACDRNIGAIEVGESVEYACLGSNAASDFQSLASVTGDVAGGGNVAAQDTLQIQVIPTEVDPPEPPPAPLGVRARAKPSIANVVWTHNGSPSYNVYRNVAGSAFSLLGNTSSIYSVFADSGLTNGIEYCYFVRAVDQQGLESADSSIACVTPQARRGRGRSR